MSEQSRRELGKNKNHSREAVMARARPASERSEQSRRCLIIERHKWETGAYKHQLQFPLDAARAFFGPDANDIEVQIRIFRPSTAPSPILQANLTVSRRYRQSATRRTNRVRAIGKIPLSFVFFEETEQAGVYDVWWEKDMAIIAAHFHRWQQAKSNQYGRGRLWLIVAAPVPRVISRVGQGVH